MPFPDDVCKSVLPFYVHSIISIIKRDKFADEKEGYMINPSPEIRSFTYIHVKVNNVVI